MKWTGEPNTATCHCSDCSYTNMDVFGERCLIDLINDALELLKEQKNSIPISWFEQYTRLKCSESWHNMALAIIETWKTVNNIRTQTNTQKNALDVR